MRDIRWASGLFEGEGCIHQVSRRSYSLQITMTDEDVIQEFGRIMDCGYFYIWKPAKSRPAHHKILYGWRVGKKKDVRKCISRMLPYLGARRTEKALEALEATNY